MVMLRIGEFSRVTGLTIKTIRLYHEKGLLPPAIVDTESAYRYYNRAAVERARVIVILRGLDLPIAVVKEILDAADDEGEILGFLEEHLETVEAKLEKYREIQRSLRDIIQREREARMVEQSSTFGVEEKILQPLLVAAIRTKGKYSDSGRLFGRLGRLVGRYASGAPLNLYYDGEYKEEDADFECCFPLRKRVEKEGVSVRELPGGKCVSLLHRGPYDELGRSYEKIFSYIHQRRFKPLLPSREVYLKGPGMIFRGNPKKYLTEIQVLIEESEK